MSRRFRDVLGHLPTGVAVIAAEDADGPVGMACNSLASVSLDPPLVSLCPAKSSATWPRIAATGRFCASVLASDHEDACRGFARRGHDRFAAVETVRRAGGPAIADAIAWIDCEIEASHDAGDHLVVLGRVLALDAHDDGRGPLVFYRGAFGSFAERVSA
jgi:3-hydroxy-9,10-secoandrosta-1,3,5(10)-triene-9,17-dione monooxygenase reductase component